MLFQTPNAQLYATVAGDGPAVVLLHGWPHTSYLWHRVIDDLARDHTVVAPDLRGIGKSSPAPGGQDAMTLAGDIMNLLDALEVQEATAVAIDAGVAPAFLAGLLHPQRVSRLVLMEGLVPGLSGAEAFFSAGPPWWFGFHAVPGLAEKVLEGHVADYVSWFLTGPSVRQDIGVDAVEAFSAAYSDPESLRSGFEIYRAGAINTEAVRKASLGSRLAIPTLAISGGVVGDALHAQLLGVADDLRSETISDCGHIVPLEQPAALLAAIRPFIDGEADSLS